MERDDWPLADPKGQPVERVREIRDEVRDRVAAFAGRERVAVTFSASIPDLERHQEGDDRDS